MIDYIIDRVMGKAPKGARRSNGWRRLRKQVLLEHPFCSVCGSRNRLEVHHKIPFHVAPDLELEKSNLVVLCENKKYGINCHLLIGHLGNYRRFNISVDIDISTWNYKITKS